MTDSEIVKALECCGSDTGSEACKSCPFDEKNICDTESNALQKYALDLINRQKAEIERLKKAGDEAVSCFNRMESLYKIKCKELEIAKSEAIKEVVKEIKAAYALFDEETEVIGVENLFKCIDDIVAKLTKGGITNDRNM